MLAGLIVPAGAVGQEPGSLPETKAPAATQAAPAPANPATPALTPSGHPLNDYWIAHDEQLLNDFGWLARFKEADLALGPPAAGENRVVFMGDSITEGWQLDESFPGKPYINRGISGQTTPQMLVRFRQDVIALKPKAVVILAGTNDIAGNTGPETLEEIEGNLASMAELGRGEPYSRGAVLGAAGVRFSVESGIDACAEDCGAECVDEGLRGGKGPRLCGLPLGDEGRAGWPAGDAEPGWRASAASGVCDYGAAGGGGD